MAYIKEMKNAKTFTIDKFYGLNCNNELELKAGESPDMRNFRITEDFRLKRREGFAGMQSIEGYPVRGMWYSGNNLSGFNNLMFTVQNGHVIAYDRDGAIIGLVGNNDVNGDSENAFMFYKNDTLYVLNGNGYFKFYDGGSGFVSVSGTIPTTFYDCNADFTLKTAYQPVNLLTGKKKVVYYPITYTSPSVTLKLPETSITGVDSIYVDNIGFLTLDDDYTINTANGTVTVTRNIGTDAAVTVQYNKENAASRALITDCLYGMFYGGDSNVDLFVWGNSNHKNTVYHSYYGDVEYFAVDNYRIIGTGEFAVTDIVAQNTKQVIFTENEIYSANMEIDDGVINYPAGIIKSERGNTLCAMTRIINNNPFFIGKDNTVWELLVSSYRDDRSIRYVSGRVQKELSSLDLSFACTIDWEAKGEYWICAQGKAIIYNYRNDVWYIFDNIYADRFIIIDDELWFASSQMGILCKFNNELVLDLGSPQIVPMEEMPICAYWTSPYMGYGADYIRKTVNGIYITLAAQDNTCSYVMLEYFTDEDIATQREEFTLPSNSCPKQLYAKISTGGFTYIKYKFISDKKDMTAQILSFTAIVNFGGYVRS